MSSSSDQQAPNTEVMELDLDPTLQSIKEFHLLARKAESKEVVQCMIRENDGATSSSTSDTTLESLEEERKRSEKLLEELKNIRIEELNEDKLNQLLDELLKRKEESFFDEEASLQQNYLIRDASLRPPEPGTVEVKTMVQFPPKEVDLNMIKVGEMLANEKREEIQQEQTLKIVRALPTGNQPSELHSVPFLSITFNQDMIEEFDAETKSFEEIDFIEIRPITENLRKGKWKWIGTKSLLFQPYFRFDRSTEFTYTVLKSKTKSVLGLSLEEDYKVTFKTQTMRVEEFVPSSYSNSFPISYLPFCYLRFDQSVDREEISKSVKITCGTKTINFEVLNDPSIIAQTLKEIEFEKKFPSVFHTYNDLLTKNKNPTSRYVWLHLLIDRQVGQSLSVNIPKGMKSLEGPLLSTHSFGSTINGFDKMYVSDHNPKKYTFYNNITPGCSFTFNTSNPIDLEQIQEKEKYVTIHPAIENCHISFGIHQITISGNTLARENYSVTIHKGLPDIYGQTLEKDYVATFEVSGESKQFNNSLPGITILPPSLFENFDPFVYFDCVNISETLTVISQVDPEFMAREVCYPKYHKSFFSSYPSYEYFQWVTKKQRSFGNIVYNEKVKPNNYVKDRSVSATISLQPYLQNPSQKTGQLFLQMKPKYNNFFSFGDKYECIWLQISNLCVDVMHVSPNSSEFTVFVTSFQDGKPVPNAKVVYTYTDQYHPTENGFDEKRTEKTTNEKGFATFKGGPERLGYHPIIYVSTENDCVVYTNMNAGYIYRQQNKLLAHIFNDRGLYKPNEIAHFKGFARSINFDFSKNSEKYGTYSINIPTNCSGTYTFYDSRRVKYADGKIEANSNGSFEIELKIPDNVNLGSHYIDIRLSGQSFTHYFSVEEFRTPEYNVSSTIIPSSFKVANYIGDKLICKVSANYYSGGALGNANVNYSCQVAPTTYNPPGWEHYTFQETETSRNIYLSRILDNMKSVTHASAYCSDTTDTTGESNLLLQLWDPQFKAKQPLQISCQANVQDINRQTQGTECKTIVHPCQYYVGVRCTKKVVLKPDDPIDCFFIVTDIQGKAVKDVPIQCKLVKLSSETKGYKSWETISPITELTIISQTQPMLHTFTLSNNTNDSAYGEYAIMCEVKDSVTPLFRSGINRCSVSIRKFGHKSHLQSKGYASLNQDTLELVANKYDSETYKPGEVASIFVSPPFSGNCTGIMWVTCNGLVQKEEFEISGETGFIELKVPIKKEYRPNIDVHVKLYGLDNYIDESNKERQLPAHASGFLKLNVSKEHHELDVSVIPKHSVTSPGKDTSVEVVVTDKEGRNQQNCEVCLIVVDEAVLDIVSHEIQDPVSTFVVQNSCQTSFISNRSDVRYWLYPRKNQRELDLNEEMQEASRNDIDEEDAECLSDHCLQCCCDFCCRTRSEACKECKKCCAEAPSGGKRKKKCLEKKDCAPPKPSANCLAGEAEDMNERKEQFAVRSSFRPDAAFITFANTDENGRVVLNFKLTDSLTRFRVTAVANMGEDLFGIGKTKITTSLPIAVRPSLPRFLNFGDMCDLTYVLQNQTTASLTVAVVCHTSNLRIFNNEDKTQRDKGVTLTIPALGRTEVRFPVRVLKCGTACIQVGLRVLNAVADKPENQDQADLMIGWSDAVKNEFRIFTPSTNEAFATYGDMSETNETILQPISLPDKPLLANFGEFTLTTSTTALSSLVDSLIYLHSYPYECNEQRASKILGIVCMKEIILQFYAPEELFNLMKIRSREEVDEFVNKELKILFDNQGYDGSYSYWSAKLFGDPYLTCYIGLCFAKCKQEGYQIPEATLRKTKSILQRIDSLFFLSFLWPRVVKDSIKSFAYYVFSLLAEPHEHDTVISLCEGILSHYKDVADLTNQLTPECAAWLSMAIHKCKKESEEEKRSSKKTPNQWLELFIQYFTENVTLDSGIYARFITRYEDSEIANMVMLHSDTRTDSLVLSCLMEIDREKSSDIIQKLVRSLLAARNASRYGRWHNTQENATCLISLTDYFKIFENQVPDMTLHSWLVDRTRSEETLYIGEESWKVRSREKKITSLPIKAFVPRKDIDAEVINPKELDSKKELLVTKSGPGRLYYRIALSYTPENLCLKSMDRGFSVYRYYEGVTKAEHVTFDKAANVWKVKAGELVRVQINITNTVKRYNVALVDKIPAGFEVVNPEIDTQIVDLNQKVDENTNGFSQSWHEHQNIRDERVEAFARMLHVGCHSFTYVARATTIGSFVIPPSHMEEMYSPECFGRSNTQFVQVYEYV